MRSQFLLFVTVMLGCSGEPTDPADDTDPSDEPPTFSRVQAEIFTPTCATSGCHDSAGRQAQLVLTDGLSYYGMISRSSVQMPGVKLIVPGDPNNSYLYRKIRGTGITGDRMPQGGPALSDEMVKLMREWIQQGAVVN